MSECIFCKIVQGEIPSTKVYEDDYVYAFKDLEPQAPVHVLVIPKKHYSSLMDVGENDEIFAFIFDAIKKITVSLGIDKTGFRVVTNTGKDGGQSVDHLHFHLLGGRNLQWPPG